MAGRPEFRRRAYALEMKPRVAILGKRGRLGAALCRELGSAFEVTALGRSDVDLSQPSRIAQSLEGLACDVFVNTAAATNVDWCEQNSKLAWAINAEGPAEIGRWTAQRQIRFVHISTDYVFDGQHEGPYREGDAADPINIYGQAKRGGEIDALAANPRTLVIRVSWVFGPDKPSFLEQILGRARQSAHVEAVGDKYGSPTYSRDFAQWLKLLLLDSSVSGVLHLCNSGGCSWREWGQTAIDAAEEIGIDLKTDYVHSIPLSSLPNFVAARPVYTVLETARFRAFAGSSPRPWQEAVREYVKQSYQPAKA